MTIKVLNAKGPLGWGPLENQKYYYDFGTGNKIPVEKNKAKTTTSQNSGKATPQPKKEKDPFLEGFNLYSDKPETPYVFSSLNQNNKSVEKRNEERNQRIDDFLAGFNQVRDEEKERLEKFARIRANADKRTWVNDKVVKEPEKQTDQFLAGFNEYADSPKWEQTDASSRKDALDKFQEVAGNSVNTTKWLLNPLKSTPYEYRDRNLIQANHNLPVRATQKGWQRMEEPLGSFGIAQKGTPNVIDIDGKPMMNQLLSLDTKYIDADGVLQESTIPEWVFNRELIKKNNAEAIDKFTKSIVPKLSEKQAAMLTETAEKFKVKNAAKVDVSARKAENFLNTVDEFSGKAKANKSFAEVTSNMSKTLDNPALKAGGKALSVFGKALDVVTVGTAIYKDYKDDEILGYESIKTAVGVVGQNAGATIGAKAGAWLGAAIGGAISGGVLSVPLAMVGGFIGGYLGSKIGETAGEKLIEVNKEYFA